MSTKIMLLIAAVLAAGAAACRQAEDGLGPSSPPTPTASVSGEVSLDATAPPTVEPSPDALSQREQDLARREEEVRRREQRTSESERRRTADRTERPASREGDARPEPVAPVGEGGRTGGEEARSEPMAVAVPGGTTFDIEFLDTVSSSRSLAGDTFEARVAEDVVVAGVAAIPVGARVIGTVTEAVPLKRVGGQARLVLRFDRLSLPSGDTPSISATFAREGRSETGRDAATIGGAAAGGAILGRVIDKKHRNRGTVLGAVVGGAVGTVIAANSPGEEVEIPSGSVVELALNEPVQVLLRR